MSMRPEEIVERADALYHDVELASVRAFREQSGAKAIGYLPIYCPREIGRASCRERV